MHKRFFITATGTGIGKTFITAALLRQAKALEQSIAAFKPVISGFDPTAQEESDTGLLLDGLGRMMTADNIERVSPWRFSAMLAPSMAAAQEGRTIDFDQIIAHSRKAIAGPENIVLIEGVGGVMVPLDGRHTVLDWIAMLGIPVLLVTGSYLGTLSHTLTALTVLKQRNVPIAAVIVNESRESSLPLADTVKELSHWIAAPLISVGLRKHDDGWRHVPELGELFD